MERALIVVHVRWTLRRARRLEHLAAVLLTCSAQALGIEPGRIVLLEAERVHAPWGRRREALISVRACWI